MMRYDQLPVFKEAYDLNLQILKSSEKVKREYKYTIVEKLKSEIDELFTCIYRACVREEKIDHITSAKEHLETIKIKIRTLHDLKQMPLNNMAKHSLSIESISKQLTAWQKALIKQQEKRELLPT